MGYLHIDNLYKFPDLSVFGKEGWAMEKIYGTSAHVGWSDGRLKFFSGGENHERFLSLFNHEELTQRLSPYENITIYGEAYGGKQQGMAHTYGPTLRFVAFDVSLHGAWLSVPETASCAG